MRMQARATPSYQLISDIENELDRKHFENEMERLLTEYEGEVHPCPIKSARIYQSENSTLHTPEITRLDSIGFSFGILSNHDSATLPPDFSSPISEGTLEDFRDEMDKTLSSPLPAPAIQEIFWIDDGLLIHMHLSIPFYLIPYFPTVKYEKCSKWLFRPLESLPSPGTFVQVYFYLLQLIHVLFFLIIFLFSSETSQSHYEI